MWYSCFETSVCPGYDSSHQAEVSTPGQDESQPPKAHVYPLPFCKENDTTAWQAMKDISQKKKKCQTRATPGLLATTCTPYLTIPILKA